MGTKKSTEADVSANVNEIIEMVEQDRNSQEAIQDQAIQELRQKVEELNTRNEDGYTAALTLAQGIEQRLEATEEVLRQASRGGYTMSLPDAMYEDLHTPLVPEAITPHPQKEYLSTIKTIYVIERMNQVFGIEGWGYTTEVIENHPERPMIVVRVTIGIPKYGIVREAFGGNDNKDRGDAYKGAVTDAISKIGGMLGIGMDVYKGFGPTTKNGGKRIVPRTEQPTTGAGQKTAAAGIPPCDDCKGKISTVTVGGDPYGPADLIKNSQKNWQANLCGDCQRKRRADEKMVRQATAAAGGPAPIR